MASTDGDWEVYANWGEYVYLMEERERYKEERRAIERERQLMREQMGDWFTPEYERFEGYLRSDESTVAFLVRGSRRCPWAKGKWLDVTDIEFGWRDTSHARGVQHYWAYDGCEDEPMGGDNETVEIQRAVIELFPQTAIPRHIPGMGMVNLFNTWRAGSRDIEKARKSGCRGQRWSVRLELVDSTQD